MRHIPIALSPDGQGPAAVEVPKTGMPLATIPACGPSRPSSAEAVILGRAIAVFAAAAALFCGGMYIGGHPAHLPGFLQDAFVDESASLNSEAVDLIENNYYRKVPDSQLHDSSLQGMVRSLKSRFSHYFTPQQNKLFEQATNGEFSGVGMTVVGRKRGLLVAGVFKGSPAKRAGVRPGDLITKVNGHSIAGEPSDLSTARIKGKPGTSVRLTIDRRGARPRTVRVTRARIKVPVVSSALRRRDGEKLGVVNLSSFTSGVHADLASAVRKLLRRGADGFVLDLRGNGGGLLEEAVLISSLFVPNGTIVTTKGRTKPKRVFDATGDTVTRKPIVVLVDRGTASASEITAAALNERIGAPIVGARTFGKGLFGQVYELSNGGALDLIVGSYYTPNGENINRKGIVPDVRAKDDPATRADEALDQALATLARRVSRG
jgi:carboxyl-terminal processing protease